MRSSQPGLLCDRLNRCHQQYLTDARNPNGYRGLGGTGVSCPIGLATKES